MSEDSLNGKIHHIEIYVKSLEITRDFWNWFLKEMGYKKFQSWSSGFSMILDETYIVFVQVEKKYTDSTYHRCHPGLNHLAFHITSFSEMEKIKKKLNKKGMTLLYEDKYPHASGNKDQYTLYFEDPNRMKIELCCSNQNNGENNVLS